jgi:hypothetical protein
MTRYLLSIMQPEGTLDPERIEPITRDVANLINEMHDAGVWVFNGGLTPPGSATVVRGDLITDGPFAEGKEHVGGICVIEAPDLDAALEWGRKASRATTLPIEVRPFSER